MLHCAKIMMCYYQLIIIWWRSYLVLPHKKVFSFWAKIFSLSYSNSNMTKYCIAMIYSSFSCLRFGFHQLDNYIKWRGLVLNKIKSLIKFGIRSNIFIKSLRIHYSRSSYVHSDSSCNMFSIHPFGGSLTICLVAVGYW